MSVSLSATTMPCSSAAAMRARTRRRRRRRGARACAGAAETLAPGRSASVLVAGATGGVGQLVTAKLLQVGYSVRAMTRDIEKARAIFAGAAASASGADGGGLEIVVADGRDEAQVASAFGDGGVRAVIDCTGTTAFPSSRWRDGGSPPSTSGLDLAPVDARACTPGHVLLY